MRSVFWIFQPVSHWSSGHCKLPGFLYKPGYCTGCTFAFADDHPAGRLQHIRSVLEAKKFQVQVSDIEFSLPQPHYTINTLHHFCKNEPHTQFVLVVGADQLRDIEQWHEWKNLLKEFPFYVYPRHGVDSKALQVRYAPLAREIVLLQAPLVTVSSTFIREGLAAGKNMNGFIV